MCACVWMGPLKNHFWKGARENFQRLAYRLGLRQAYPSKKRPKKKDCCGDTALNDIPYSSEESKTLELQSASQILRGVEPTNLYDPSLHFGVRRHSSPVVSESVDQPLPRIEYRILKQARTVNYNRQNYHAIHLLECYAINFGVCGDSPAIIAKPIIEWGRRFARAAKNASCLYTPTQNLVVLLATTSVLRLSHKSIDEVDDQSPVPSARAETEQLLQGGLRRITLYPSNFKSKKPIGWVMLPMPIYDEA